MRHHRLILTLCLILGGTSAFAAADARLLTMDAAEPIEHPVLGLQRSAVPLVAGIAVDTSLIGDLGLVLNLGLRWGQTFGPHTAVVGARWSQFVGGAPSTSLAQSISPLVKRFEPLLSGPTVYALYGIGLGALSLHLEGRYSHLNADLMSVTSAGVVSLGGGWGVLAELGWRIIGSPALHAAAGVRFTGANFGFSLGAAYLGLDDPLFPAVPVIPALDLSWSFS